MMMTAFQVLKSIALLLLPVVLGFVSVSAASDQHIFADTTIATLRTATWDDLDQIVTVFFDAFSTGPGFRYVRPDYKGHEDYMKYCLKQSFKELFQDGVPPNVYIKVITVPHGEGEQVVALAGWQLLIKGEQSKVNSLQDSLLLWDSITNYKDTDKPKYDCSLNLGTNTTRAAYHQRELNAADEKYINSQFDRHLYLAALATHPTWDGHNFGAMNLHWGMELAKTKDVPITLLATPAGYPLYRSVGFQNLHNITIKMLDGEGELWYEAMKYESE